MWAGVSETGLPNDIDPGSVYAGIPRFSLRARENPFNNSTIRTAIDQVHKKKKKIYLTANILPPNRKIASFGSSVNVIRPTSVVKITL